MTSSSAAQVLSLGADRIALDRASTPQRVADLLRERVLEGQLPPGTQFAEQQLVDALGISRNTLREAFQVLIAERLLVHEPHRGVFVRRLSAVDVADIYAVRRLLECAALEHPAEASNGLAEMRLAVDAGRAAARRRRWQQVGTADVRFHVAVTALAGSDRLDRVVRGLFAELRLSFQLVPDPHALHAPFLARNAEILDLAERRQRRQASRAMRAYLDDAEQRVLAALDGP
jgi:DNA-binding GntR family transcriptional regulator